MADEKDSKTNGAEHKNDDSNGVEESNGTKGIKRKGDESAVEQEEPPKKEQKTLEQTLSKVEGNAEDPEREKQDEKDAADAKEKEKEMEKTGNDDEAKEKQAEGTIEESEERRQAQPSNISEKGIIYFFVRGRVDTDELEGVQDIARSYIVLRPLPEGAKLNDGPLQDLKTNRLLALPKKVLPKSHQDRFMVFVEKAGVTVKELKDEFMKGTEYSTQTTGVRHTPPVTAVGEGVYAVTRGERDTHLAYMLTIPATPGDVQDSLGIYERGSFILSLKNPQSKGPANTNLPEAADFPKDVIDEFRGRAWMPPTAKHLDYPNAQFLLIGEGIGKLDKAVEPASEDKGKEEKDTPLDHMETLHEEDEKRVEGLDPDHAIFADLHVSRKDFPDVQTTW